MSKTTETLIEQHKNLVVYVIKRWFPNKLGDDDIMQIGMIALWKAIEKYDENKKASLETFAVGCIRNGILRELQKQNTKNKNKNNQTEVSLDGHGVWLDEITPDNSAYMENVIAIKDYITRKSEEEKQMIYLKASGKTTKQIANQMNLAKRTAERRWAKIRTELKDVL